MGRLISKAVCKGFQTLSEPAAVALVPGAFTVLGCYWYSAALMQRPGVIATAVYLPGASGLECHLTLPFLHT